MDRERALRKLIACLRLAKSSEPAEAAAALRQAQKLMAEYGLDEQDAAAAEVSEKREKTRYRGNHAPDYLIYLAVMVARVFGCDLVQSRERATRGGTTEFVFLGPESAIVVAAYSFVVLRRQMEGAAQLHLRRVRKRAVKEARRARFCLAWVAAVYELLRPPELDPTRSAEIEAYKARHFGPPSSDAGRRTPMSNSRSAQADIDAGAAAGRRAQLHRGVAGGDQRRLGCG